MEPFLGPPGSGSHPLPLKQSPRLLVKLSVPGQGTTWKTTVIHNLEKPEVGQSLVQQLTGETEATLGHPSCQSSVPGLSKSKTNSWSKHTVAARSPECSANPMRRNTDANPMAARSHEGVCGEPHNQMHSLQQGKLWPCSQLTA